MKLFYIRYTTRDTRLVWSRLHDRSRSGNNNIEITIHMLKFKDKIHLPHLEKVYSNRNGSLKFKAKEKFIVISFIVVCSCPKYNQRFCEISEHCFVREKFEERINFTICLSEVFINSVNYINYNNIEFLINKVFNVKPLIYQSMPIV